MTETTRTAYISATWGQPVECFRGNGARTAQARICSQVGYVTHCTQTLDLNMLQRKKSGVGENHLYTNQASATIISFTMAGFSIGLEVGKPAYGSRNLRTGS
jgi:hypothetical protein